MSYGFYLEMESVVKDLQDVILSRKVDIVNCISELILNKEINPDTFNTYNLFDYFEFNIKDNECFNEWYDYNGPHDDIFYYLRGFLWQCYDISIKELSKNIYKESKVTFNKSGSGSISGKVTIPTNMLQALNITQDDREVVISLIDNSIIIQKKGGLK